MYFKRYSWLIIIRRFRALVWPRLRVQSKRETINSFLNTFLPCAVTWHCVLISGDSIQIFHWCLQYEHTFLYFRDFKRFVLSENIGTWRNCAAGTKIFNYPLELLPPPLVSRWFGTRGGKTYKFTISVDMVLLFSTTHRLGTVITILCNLIYYWQFVKINIIHFRRVMTQR